MAAQGLFKLKGFSWRYFKTKKKPGSCLPEVSETPYNFLADNVLLIVLPGRFLTECQNKFRLALSTCIPSNCYHTTKNMLKS
jgi:hypothetical protein